MVDTIYIGINAQNLKKWDGSIICGPQQLTRHIQLPVKVLVNKHLIIGCLCKGIGAKIHFQSLIRL